MRVRAVDVNHEWMFGKGRNDYITDNLAIGQNIKTRLLSFLGDCFFDQTAGIDWFNYLGGKDRFALELAIRAIILNTEGVTGINQLFSNLFQDRLLSVSYSVFTVYSQVSNTVEVDLSQPT